MWNRRKWYSFLLVGLALLLAISFVGCGESYTQEDLDAARKAGSSEGYDIGLAEGKSNKEKAVKQAYDKGYWAGYAEAQDEGYDKGYETGYQNGFWAGEDEALKLCRDMAEDNYYQGYVEGLAACRNRGPYVGSIKSDKYHYPTCYWAKQINPENEIWFSSSADAKAHGYRACKVCNPPGSEQAKDPWAESAARLEEAKRELEEFREKLK